MFEDFLFRTFIDRVIVWNKNLAELKLEIIIIFCTLRKKIDAAIYCTVRTSVQIVRRLIVTPPLLIIKKTKFTLSVVTSIHWHNYPLSPIYWYFPFLMLPFIVLGFLCRTLSCTTTSPSSSTSSSSSLELYLSFIIALICSFKSLLTSISNSGSTYSLNQWTTNV